MVVVVVVASSAPQSGLRARRAAQLLICVSYFTLYYDLGFLREDPP